MANNFSPRQYLDAREFVKNMGQRKTDFWFYDKSIIKLRYYRYIRFLNLDIGICIIQIYGVDHLAVVEGKVVRLIEANEISKLAVDHILAFFPDATEELDKYDVLDVVTQTSPVTLERKVLSFLPKLEVQVKHDTVSASYLFYQNKIVKVTAETVIQMDYENFDGLVLAQNILNRRFRRVIGRKRGEIKQYVWNLSGRNRSRYYALMAALGYLIHQYKDPANPKIVVLIDQIIGETETNNGGTGKSLLFKALTFVRNVVELSGKRNNTMSRFVMQRVTTHTDIVFVNDVSRHENIDNWFNFSADGFQIERKYKSEVVIPAEFSPKICMTTNHMVKRSEGNSSERRLQEYEVSDYYGPHLNPQTEFGHNLYYDWDQDQWGLFDDFMISCIQLYLQRGLIQPPKINIEKRKMFLEVGIELKEFLDDKIAGGVTKIHKAELYKDYRDGNFVQLRYLPSRNSFTRRVKKYLEYNHLPYRETPADKKLYIEIITEKTVEAESIRTVKDFDVDYKTVDSNNKITRMLNKLGME